MGFEKDDEIISSLSVVHSPGVVAVFCFQARRNACFSGLYVFVQLARFLRECCRIESSVVCHGHNGLLYASSVSSAASKAADFSLTVELYVFFNGRFYWLPLYSIVYFSALSHLKTSWCAAMAVLCLQAFCPGLDEAVRYSLVRNLVGLLIVFSTLILYVKSGKNSLSRSVKWLSDISYPLYLVHNLLMVGPFSLSRATPYTCLNVSLMLACSLGLALLLQRVAYFAGKKF